MTIPRFMIMARKNVSKDKNDRFKCYPIKNGLIGEMIVDYSTCFMSSFCIRNTHSLCWETPINSKRHTQIKILNIICITIIECLQKQFVTFGGYFTLNLDPFSLSLSNLSDKTKVVNMDQEAQRLTERFKGFV